MKAVVYGNDLIGPWIESHGGGYYRQGSQCIGLERNGELIAGVMYDSFNDASICIHVAISNKHAICRDYLKAVFHYPFIQLKCQVLIGIVPGDNYDAIRFDEHIGFTLEHIIKDADPSGELRIYTMRPEQCKWINYEQTKSAAAA